MSVANALVKHVDAMEKELVSLLQRLVQTPSYPGTEEQNTCLNLIEEFLTVPGIRHDRWIPDWQAVEQFTALSNDEILYTANDAFPDVRDGIAVLVSEYGDGERCLVLNGHVDIAGVEPLADWTVDPFSATIRDGKLYGRGAMDMKGGVVAIAGALRAIAEVGVPLAGRVQVHTVPEEESGGNGTLATLVRGYTGDGWLFAEPSDLKIIHHHTGIQEFKIEVRGRAGAILWHKPGVDSIYPLARILVALEELQAAREIEARRRMPDFEDNDSPGFVNVGFIRAGEWTATRPTIATASGLMSLLPGETPGEALRALEETVRDVSLGDPWFEEHPPTVSYRNIGHMGAALSAEHELVQAFVRGAVDADIDGVRATRGQLMVSDAKIVSGGGFAPSVVFGPKGTGLHSPDEYVELESVIQLAKAIAVGVVNYLST